MPKIDFYILDTPSAQQRLLFTCRLLEKAYRNKNRVYVHADNQEQAHEIDELLWTFKDDSFVPHNLYGEGPEPPPAIQIGFDSVPQKQNDLLINLNTVIPDFYTQFARVIEIISSDTTIQTTGREHYRQYRSAGFDINTHKLPTVV